MKTLLTLLIFLCSFSVSLAQSIDISSDSLPYTIPIMQEGVEGVAYQWRWLENSKIIPGADSSTYTIPAGKPDGSYTYVNQVKCEACSDWLSSNPFTVNIYSGTINSTSGPISVTFSPQSTLEGYLDKLIEVIDNSQQSLEISLYTISDYEVFWALKNAASRGVQVRMLFDGASEDRHQDSSTVSHQIETAGIDVRYVNKINHHKFLVADNNFLVTSSGNWNGEANWIYDENTLWISDEELVLRYRAEFELLWNNSREFGGSFGFSSTNIDPDSLLNLVADNPNVDAVFTSSNYRTYNSSTYGPTFALISGNQKVADRIVQMIDSAEHSIYIAANHLRSRPISEALIAKKAQYPQIDIKVYLDEQEYVSEEYNAVQIAERNTCLAEATTPGQERDCWEEGFYWSYELIDAGIDVRFKTYSYSWHQNTSALMHHKYALFDDSLVATGSYNYSYNAETNSMENVLILDNVSAPATVADFIQNFETIWNTGREEGFYEDILAHISTDSRYIPVLFPSMSLSYGELRALKENIATACPTVLDPFFRNNKEHFSTFLRDVSLGYDEADRLVTAQDSRDNKFTSNYTYNGEDVVTGVSFQSNDGLQFQESYQYDGSGNLIQLNAPQFSLSLTYNSNELATLDAGRGAHSWDSESNGAGILTRYSTPTAPDYLSVQWNKEGLPLELTDADARTVQWQYNSENVLTSISAGGRNISFTADETQQNFNITSSDGETIAIQQPDVNELNFSSTGTVNAGVQYTTEELADKNILLNIGITSNNISSGFGRTAAVEYLLDPYGRVIQSGDMYIAREPYSGNIISIENGGITETRQYDDWELLTRQEVLFEGQVYYAAQYDYDGLQRIKTATEIILGDTALYEYNYNGAGQLQSVYKNDTLTEQYAYDAFGNRILSTAGGYDYFYTNDSANRLNEFSWEQSGNTRKSEFAYNNSGQLLGTVNKTKYGAYFQATSSRNYEYDVFGNLNQVSWASQTRNYKYGPYDRRIATYHNGAVQGKLIYGLESVPVAELNENDRIINTFVYADGYAPLLMRKGNTDYYLISDIRGSVRMAVKVSTGDVRQRMDYDAFGNVLEDTNPGYTPFGYAGGLYDYRTDLVRFGARDYFPEIGRWTAEDPIGFLSGDVNFYAYVANDPVNFVDPSGFSKSGSCNNIAIVIGERMHRVNAAAQDLRKQGYDVKVYDPRNFRSSHGNLNPLDIKANRSWLSYWTQKKGAKVFDICIDKNQREFRSPFYSMENRSIYVNWKYNNVVKLPGY